MASSRWRHWSACGSGTVQRVKREMVGELAEAA